MGAGFSKPDRFVICWPVSLRDSGFEKKWDSVKKAFEQRTQINADLWHLDLLNGWLKKLPDVVADLFSDRHAQNFCGVDEWLHDLFKPLRQGISGEIRIKRYLQRRNSGRLYVDERYSRLITEALESAPAILIHGPPGTGKTLTSLAVAEDFRGGGWRVYFLDAGSQEVTTERLRKGIRARDSRPSIVVLEDCHENPDTVAQVLRELEPELKTGRIKVICLARRASGPDDSRSDDSDLYLELKAQDGTVGFENDAKLLQRVVAFWKPNFKGLSQQRLQKLIALCGRDLLLLDEVLARIDRPAEIDAFSPADLYDSIRNSYFDYETPDNLVATRRLAALAQFDIRPRADVIQIPENEALLVENGFGVRAGRPPRWHMHSSAAELLLHTLWHGMGVTDLAVMAEQAGQDIIGYFTNLQAEGVRPPEEVAAMETDLLGVVRNPLKLGAARADHLKAKVLDSEPVWKLLPRLASLPTYARAISMCARIAHRTSAATAPAYAQRLSEACKALLNTSEAQRLVDALPVFSMMQHSLKLTAPALHADLNRDLDANRFLQLINDYGTVFELFEIVKGGLASAGPRDD